MFEDTTELLSLYQAIDKIKNRFGFDAVSMMHHYKTKAK
jgi:DNA polymerase-4